MLNSLLQLPAWMVIVGLTGATVLLVLGGSYVARTRFGEYHIVREDNMIANILLRQISTLLSVILAFAVISTWQDFELQRKNTAEEASVMGNLYRDSRGFSPLEESTVQRSLVAYTMAVVEDAWPKMREKVESREAWLKFNALYGYVIRLEPRNSAETIVLTQMVGHMNDLARFRRLRLLRNESPLIPTVLWVVILCSTGLMIISGYFLRTQDPRMKTIMTLISASIFGMIFSILLLLNHPYSGSMQISPAPLEHLLDDVFPAADMSQSVKGAGRLDADAIETRPQL